MSFDALLKKYFGVWVCGLICAAAYFQASGLGSLVVGTMNEAQTANVPPATQHARAVNSSAPPKSAQPILARNAFDSVTGPLDGKPGLPEDGLPAVPVKNANNPYDDPPCSGVKVSLVTASDDPQWSFASLSKDGKSELRRKGDKIGDAEVINIGWYPDATEPTPRVWLNEGGARCLVTWGSNDGIRKPPPPKPGDTPPPMTGGIPPNIEAKIHKKGENDFDVERSAVNEIIKNYAQLAAGLHARATKEGVRLSGIKSSSILNTLGMKNGDVLKSINGYDMSDQDKALEAYAKLKTSKSLSIEVERGGSPVTIAVGIQ